MNRHALRLALVLSLFPLASPVAAARASAADTQAQSSTKSLYLTLIRQARDDGHTRAALAFLDDYEREYPGDSDAAILRVNCLLDLGQLADAQAALTRLPARKLDGPAHTVRGHVFAAAANWNGAIAEYTAALVTIPSDSLTINALGYAQMRAGQTDAAVETLKRARELSPGDPVIRNNLLLALTVSGRKEEADSLLARSGNPAFQADLRTQVGAEVIRLAGIPGGTEAKP